ncbi:SMI1/KNR4 family protein [Kitasatospora sp. NPDC058162]|uniref:SMI1/KNR4 family protein n=1 Tax=Kitasatospora sp. NPDC058162 TaxID=3346362 RepID=UPI0036DDEC7D
MDTMAEDALIDRVRQHAGPALPPPVTAGQLAAAEAEIGYPLPSLFARLYREVGDGGYGPDRFPLWPLRRVAAGGPGRPYGVLEFLDWGCGMTGAVDCLHPDAPVLLVLPDDETHPIRADSPSLARWLADWLDGRAWWEEEVMAANEGEMLPPWPDAAARFSAQPPCPER